MTQRVLNRKPRRSTKPINTVEDFEQVYPDYHDLLDTYHERIRQRAEKGIRSLIQKEYQRRLAQALRATKGIPNPRTRMRAARKRTGFDADEVFGGVLGLDAALGVVRPLDVPKFAALDRTGDRTFGGAESILVKAEALGGVSEGDIVDCILNARQTVRVPARLREAQAALEKIKDSGGALQPEDVERFKRLAGRGRRRLRR